MTYRIANSPIQGHFSGVRSTYGRVLRRGYGVDDGGPPRLHLDLLDEGVAERPGLSQLAGLEVPAHVLSEGGDGVGAVQELPAAAPCAIANTRRERLPGDMLSVPG